MEEKDIVAPLSKAQESTLVTPVTSPVPTSSGNSKSEKSKLPRIIGGVVTLVVLAAAAFFLFNKQTAKVYRVGILFGIDPLAGIVDSFKVKMTELGYIENKNITYDVQKTDMDPAKMQKILKKFVDNKVDLIFAFPSEAAFAAKTATKGTDVPVVFAHSTMEGNDLVGNVRQPGGNITGVREPGPDIFVKRLEILHEIAPQAKRIYITYDPSAPPIPPALEALRKVLPRMNIVLVENPVTTVGEIKADLQARDAMADTGIDAILIMGGALSVAPPALEAMIKFSTEHKIPLGGIGRYSIGKSIVFGYEIDLDDVGKLAAPLADKIFKGTPVGTIPVVTPEAKLLINYKVAQGLGLIVPEGLLNKADEIIR